MSVLIECLYANHTGMDGSKLPHGFWELKSGPVELQRTSRDTITNEKSQYGEGDQISGQSGLVTW